MTYSHEQFLIELGKNLRQMRIERGWSLRDMIAKHGFHLAHWQGFEKGKGVSVRSLLRLCEVFDISLEELIGGLGRVPPNVITEPNGDAATLQKSASRRRTKVVHSAS